MSSSIVSIAVIKQLQGLETAATCFGTRQRQTNDIRLFIDASFIRIIMVNGPPTPPATTPAELRDEGRAQSAHPQPTQSVATLRPETLRIVKVFNDLVVRRDYARLVRAAEDVDINVRIVSR